MKNQSNGTASESLFRSAGAPLRAGFMNESARSAMIMPYAATLGGFMTALVTLTMWTRMRMKRRNAVEKCMNRII